MEDIRNISRNAIRKNMFDQDALESFLEQESSKNKGFRYYLRKYSTYDKGTNDMGTNDKVYESHTEQRRDNSFLHDHH